MACRGPDTRNPGDGRNVLSALLLHVTKGLVILQGGDLYVELFVVSRAICGFGLHVKEPTLWAPFVAGCECDNDTVYGATGESVALSFTMACADRLVLCSSGVACRWGSRRVLRCVCVCLLPGT